MYYDKRGFHQGIIAQFNDALVEEVLQKTPNGMRFHLIDIAIDELALVNPGISTEEFINVLEPYVAIAQAEEDKIVKKKVFENVFLKFLVKYSCFQDLKEEGGEEEDAPIIFDNVDVEGVAEFLFEVGKAAETRDGNRKMLYDMNKTYLKRVAKRMREAKEGLFGDVNEESEEEGEEVVLESAKKGPKKGPKKEKEKEKEKKEEEKEVAETTPKRKRKASVDINEMRDSDEDLKSPPKEDRRVSFASKNKSKGYKKSMKDLTSSPCIISPPPKRGVLNKKKVAETQRKLEEQRIRKEELAEERRIKRQKKAAEKKAKAEEAEKNGEKGAENTNKTATKKNKKKGAAKKR